MRFSPLLAVFLLSAGLHLSATAGDGIVDLTALANYAAQPIPAYVNKSNTPPNNLITDKGATLGRILFYDKRLSRNDTISCATCHQQAHGFGDGGTASTGVAGTTGRHSMRLINARFATEAKFFWDERAVSLEAQTSRPIQDHVEMGFSGTSGDPAFSALITKLSAIDDYRVLFISVFGNATITEARVQFALAQFIRSIQSFDSRYDAGRALDGDATNFPNFSGAENAGKTLFLNPPPQGGAGCAGCHRPPEFDIAPGSGNNGVITQIGGGTDLTNVRSPSLRDLLGPGGQSNGPFMHDGSLTTLAAVIGHYAAIPGLNANLDPRLQPGGQPQRLNLNPTQRANLAAFLATLTGTAVYTDARWSDPFDANGQLNLVVLPAESISLQNNGNGTATLTCDGVSGVQYQLRSSTNMTTWTSVATVTASAAGVCTATVPVTGGVFYRFAYVPAAARPAAATSITLASPSTGIAVTTASKAAAGSTSSAAVRQRVPAARQPKRR